MKKSLLIILFVFSVANLFAQGITGDWYGLLELPKGKLHVVFHVKNDGSGFSTTMDSPDQGASGIKTDTTTYEGGRLTVEIKAMHFKYTGSFDNAANQINGTFQQGKGELPLVLKRTKEETKRIARPQDPVDFPYTQEEVSFKNIKDTVTLAGTLTLPKGKKADKIVILITGSGAQNRDEELRPFNHRPFLVWSDWLTRNGIAVLRYDDRGVSKSTGNFSKSTSADFARDVTAAIDYIKSRNDLKGMSIGLIGHSEGGMIAPMVASRDKRVAFIVLLAGPGISIDKLMIQQTEYAQASQHVPAELAALNIETSRQIYSYLKEHGDEPTEKSDPALRQIFKTQLAKYPADVLKDMSVDDMVNKQMATYSPWLRCFLAYDPASTLSKVKCPVLAMNGTTDRQVSATENLKGIEGALKKGKNKHYAIRPMEGLNHLLQKSATGDVSQYGDIDETVNQAALDEVLKWINKL